MQQQARSHLLTGSSCAIWLSYLVVADHVCQAVPWVFLLGGLLFSSLTGWLRVRQELQFSIESSLAPEPKSTVAPDYHQDDDRSLAEITAPIVALISIALPAVLLASYLVLHIDLTQLRKPVKQRQVVEIELVAPSDTIDRQEILPATSKEVVGKAQKGALYTVASSALRGASVPLSKPELQQKPAANLEPKQKAKLNPKPEPKLEPQPAATEPKTQQKLASAHELVKEAPVSPMPLTFKAPNNWKTIVVAKEKDNSVDFSTYSASAAARSVTTDRTKTNTRADSQKFLSEVEPANMIESIDSDGQLSPLTIQTGGRSKDGAGAASNLHQYLKLLNSRVKRLWIPPRGIDRIAVIEFRINASGKLISCKALAHTDDSRGSDSEAEAAAMAAINKAFPFLPLPAEIKAPHLDVQYTFNYRFNQIDELKN